MKITFFIIWICLGLYMLYPNTAMPMWLPEALKSNEPADTETINRQSFFTNLKRAEIIEHFDKNFVGLINYRLNYPPEESNTWIRDLTPSSFLEEIVHPLKQSIYINGFTPTKPTEQINRGDAHYETKVTIHYFPGGIVTRLTIWLMLGLVSYRLIREYAEI